MDLRTSIEHRLRSALTATTFVMLVLVGSVVVAAVLAGQAMTAAQQRRDVTDSMLREYARLAAWEFSREAAKDIDRALMHTLGARIHKDRHTGEEQCDCVLITAVDEWFEVPQTSAAGREDNSGMEGGVRTRLSENDGRIVAVRWDPHVGASGGEIGLIIKPQALRPVLERAHRRASLLPTLQGEEGETARFVDLQVRDREGREVFASTGTTAGPQGFEANLLPNAGLDLRISTSMTPAFVAGLGSEHGAGPSRALVFGLVIVNGVLVTIGLWQLARERELARLRADFVAGVSHELRTPLAQIRMFADTLLLDRIRNPDEGRRAVEIISRETRRLGQLVENVLVFHRHERVPVLEATEDVDLVALIRDVVDNFGPIAASRRVQVTYETTAAVRIVRASPDGLRQVMLNLLDNAVKFGPPDQTVRVALDDGAEGVRIAIEDSGPGIPERDRKRIFNAFERGRDTRGAGGAGIGLAVVRQIVAAHKGTVAVETAATGGARLVVTLPPGDQMGDRTDAEIGG